MGKSTLSCLICMVLLASAATGSCTDRSARDRLVEAAETTRLLEAKAECADEGMLARAVPAVVAPEKGAGFDGGRLTGKDRVFPRLLDSAKYDESRPWAVSYAPLHDPNAAIRPRQPADEHRLEPSHAEALRKVLADADPAMRALAAEALATLMEPDDVLRIARLLSDRSPAPPLLAWNQQMSALFIPPWDSEKQQNPVDLWRSWRTMTVGDYARRAIYYMTGERLDARSFRAWWRVHGLGRESLWYWQQRMRHQTASAERKLLWEAAESSARGLEIPHRYWTDRLRYAREAALAGVERDLNGQSPEVEAKVKLLAFPDHSLFWEVPRQPSDSFFPVPLALRLSHERVLELLDRQNLWPDVDWQDEYSSYNRMVDRMALSGEKLFTPGDVGRLRSVLLREKANLAWDAKAGLNIAISRLLPPAKGSDDPNTRQGWLRKAFREEEGIFSQGRLARELLETDLPGSWDLLKERFFAETDTSHVPNLRSVVLTALGDQPLSREKRRALVDLLLDARFVSLWTGRGTSMADSSYQEAAIRAVNAHAGRQMLNESLRDKLRDPATSERALGEVLDAIRAWDSKSQSTRRPLDRMYNTQGPT